MATTQTQIRQTGFKVGSTEVRFGIAWPDGGYLMTDWARQPKEAVLDGLGETTIIQLFGMSPRSVTYRLFFETVDDFMALDALVQQSGRLRIVANGHSVPVDEVEDNKWIFDRLYTNLPNVLLRSLTPIGVAPDETHEAEALFTVAS